MPLAVVFGLGAVLFLPGLWGGSRKVGRGGGEGRRVRPMMSILV